MHDPLLALLRIFVLDKPHLSVGWVALTPLHWGGGGEKPAEGGIGSPGGLEAAGGPLDTGQPLLAAALVSPQQGVGAM